MTLSPKSTLAEPAPFSGERPNASLGVSLGVPICSVSLKDLDPVTRRTKDKLLYLIKRTQRATVQELSTELCLSQPAVRRHLQDLQDLGLVALELEKPTGRGRPQHVYQLTEAGHATFPRNYELLCSDVLEHLETLFGAGAVEQVFDARRMKLERELSQRCQQPTLPERVQALAAALQEHGYQAYAEERGGVWYLIEQNCPAPAVACTHPAICHSEQVMYQNILGCVLVRESHIASGAAQCCYRVQPHTSSHMHIQEG